jgi:hypothetical protein
LSDTSQQLPGQFLSETGLEIIVYGFVLTATVDGRISAHMENMATALQPWRPILRT